MDRKICPECQVEIHQKMITYNGEEKLSWRNPDGSAHFFYEDGEIYHTPTRNLPLEIKLEKILKGIEEIKGKMR